MTLSFVVAGGIDDSHITYWPAHTLSRWGQIVNFNGAVLEQSSALATTVLLAALSRLLPFISLPTLGWALSMVAGTLAIVCAARLADRVVPGSGVFAAPAVATNPAFFYWASSGMEASLTGLALVLLPLSLDSHLKEGSRGSLVRLGLAQALLATVRPEGVMYLVCGELALLPLVARALAWRTSEAAPLVRRTLESVGSAACIAAALFSFRRVAFGEWFPHPVSAKVGGQVATMARVWEGLSYLDGTVRAYAAPLFAAGMLGLVVAVVLGLGRRPGGVAALTAGALGFASLSFMVTSGGDWMPVARFLAPTIPILAALAILGTRVMAGPAGGGVVALAVCIAGAQSLRALEFLQGEGSGRPWDSAMKLHRLVTKKLGPRASAYSFTETVDVGHLRDILAGEEVLDLTSALRRQGTDPVWLMSGQVGQIPYHVFREHYGHARLVDMWSLATKDIDPCLPSAPPVPSKWGVSISYDWFFANAERIEKECGIPKPHIIFSNGTDAAFFARLRSFGYEIAYTQSGFAPFFRTEGFWRQNHVGIIDYFVAVRSDVWAKLHRKPKNYRFDMVPERGAR